MERDMPRHLYNYNFQNFQKILSKVWFNILLKNKMRQFLFYSSLVQFMRWKYNIDLEKNKIIKYIFAVLSLFVVEIFLSFLKNTNTMWFIILKK